MQTQIEHWKTNATELRLQSTAKENALLRRIEEAQKANDANCTKVLTEMAVLQEKNLTLQARLDHERECIKEHRAVTSIREAELLERVEQSRADLDREVNRSMQLKIRSEEDITGARRQIADLESRLKDLKTKLDAAPVSSTMHKEETDSLKAQILHGRSEYEALKKRTDSLNGRYDSGDLDAEERILIKKIMEVTRAMHNQELAAVQNELRRRDNLINNLQDAKNMLENSLAKHLQVEVCHFTRIFDLNLRIKFICIQAKKGDVAMKSGSGTTVTEFVNWPSSDPSVVDSVPPAQDEDEPVKFIPYINLTF
ncbi:hypothetical protein K439DRAFT_409521 [Ramaria rubella]|nr:hypothetical protein K439DRAFT_409521 [Ramaria rubella]